MFLFSCVNRKLFRLPWRLASLNLEFMKLKQKMPYFFGEYCPIDIIQSRIHAILKNTSQPLPSLCSVAPWTVSCVVQWRYISAVYFSDLYVSNAQLRAPLWPYDVRHAKLRTCTLQYTSGALSNNYARHATIATFVHAEHHFEPHKCFWCTKKKLTKYFTKPFVSERGRVQWAVWSC